MSHKLKVFKKLLDIGDNQHIVDETLTDLLQNELDTNMENKLNPRSTDKYVGIEIECFSRLDAIDVMELVFAYDLEKHLNIGEDGSIETDGDEETYEFRLLVKEKELSKIFKRLAGFLKEGNFQVNSSCGLHIHLDMRNRDVEKCYNKLLKFQQMMFPLVKSNRWVNEYCDWAVADQKLHHRMTAINYLAYAKHQTLEIRLHHGTTNVARIENWVRLLLKAINGPAIKDINYKKDAIKWAGKNKKLKAYITKHFNPKFFKAKSDVVLGYDGQNETDDNTHEDFG